MVENINEINFEDNKPWLAPHYPFSLEGHWQPWYDDRRDYNTNAPTYYDYLSNFNHLIKSITELLNRVARRNINVQDTHCVDLTKIGDWIDEGGKCHSYSDVITLKADVILSTYKKAVTFDGNQFTLANIISCLETGLYSPDYMPLLNHLSTKLNQEIHDRVEADKVLDAKINKEITDRKAADAELQRQITKEVSDRTAADNELLRQLNNEIQGRKNGDAALQQNLNNEIKARTDGDTNLQNQVNDLKTKVATLTTALQKIVTNLNEGGNATTKDLNTFVINNKIAAGNINLYGGTSDGNTLIRTHTGSAENDVTVGQKG
jgi:hypothetical protein